MDKDKKNIDYWDKYYGSGKDKKDPPPEYSKRYSPKTQKENSSGNKSGRSNPEPAGRIIGSEYKKNRAAKKRRRSPALRFTIIIIFIALVGFLIFYSVDNHLFSGGTSTEKTNGIQSNSASASQSTPTDSSDTNTASSTETLSTDTSAQDSTNTAAATSDGTQIDNGQSSQNMSFWQALVLFFKNFGKDKSETANYPRNISLNVYFAVLGNGELFGSEIRTIMAGSPKIAATSAIAELLKGPYEDFNFAVIPAGTKLISVEIANKIARVNFSQEFLSESLDSSILDNYIIYTIVNTLTEIPGIEALSFSIDGKVIKGYGTVDLQLPAIRNEKYLETK